MHIFKGPKKSPNFRVMALTNCFYCNLECRIHPAQLRPTMETNFQLSCVRGVSKDMKKVISIKTDQTHRDLLNTKAFDYVVRVRILMDEKGCSQIVQGAGVRSLLRLLLKLLEMFIRVEAVLKSVNDAVNYSPLH